LTKKPSLLYSLSTLWALLGLLFIYLGYYSLQLAIIVLSSEAEFNGWSSMLFFGFFFLTTALLVFGAIFFIFTYETLKLKSWVWDAGIIISTIFLVIFSFMLSSSMITALLFPSAYFTVNVLIMIILVFLIDLGIIFLITRPNIKVIMHSQQQKNDK